MDVSFPGALFVGDSLPLEGEDAHHAGVGPAHRAVLPRVVVAVVITRTWNNGEVSVALHFDKFSNYGGNKMMKLNCRSSPF